MCVCVCVNLDDIACNRRGRWARNRFGWRVCVCVYLDNIACNRRGRWARNRFGWRVWGLAGGCEGTCVCVCVCEGSSKS